MDDAPNDARMVPSADDRPDDDFDADERPAARVVPKRTRASSSSSATGSSEKRPRAAPRSDFRIAEHLSVGAGGLLSVNFVPDALAPLYGDHNPIGAMGFLRLRLN